MMKIMTKKFYNIELGAAVKDKAYEMRNNIEWFPAIYQFLIEVES